MDASSLEAFLDAFHVGPRGPIKLVIHGGAQGADTMAGEWAQSRGIACMAFAANWATEGRAAGPIRNKRMLDEVSPNVVVAFPGGRGTANMVGQARDRGFEVLIPSQQSTR